MGAGACAGQVALRHRATLVVIPMLNPDGTFLGNYRTCSLGTDLNRMWGNPTEATEPTLYHTKELIRRLSEDDTVQLGAARASDVARVWVDVAPTHTRTETERPLSVRAGVRRRCGVRDADFVIDIHAHSTATTGFFLCNPPEDKTDIAECAPLLPLAAQPLSCIRLSLSLSLCSQGFLSVDCVACAHIHLDSADTPRRVDSSGDLPGIISPPWPKQPQRCSRSLLTAGPLPVVLLLMSTQVRARVRVPADVRGARPRLCAVGVPLLRRALQDGLRAARHRRHDGP